MEALLALEAGAALCAVLKPRFARERGVWWRGCTNAERGPKRWGPTIDGLQFVCWRTAKRGEEEGATQVSRLRCCFSRNGQGRCSEESPIRICALSGEEGETGVCSWYIHSHSLVQRVDGYVLAARQGRVVVSVPPPLISIPPSTCSPSYHQSFLLPDNFPPGRANPDNPALLIPTQPGFPRLA